MSRCRWLVPTYVTKPTSPTLLHVQPAVNMDILIKDNGVQGAHERKWSYGSRRACTVSVAYEEYILYTNQAMTNALFANYKISLIEQLV